VGMLSQVISFLINIFKGKINVHSISDTFGSHVLTRQIREFDTFRVSSELRHSPSARCAIAANDVYRFLGLKIKSFLRTLSRYEKLDSLS
jgi:hypothetical protein